MFWQCGANKKNIWYTHMCTPHCNLHAFSEAPTGQKAHLHAQTSVSCFHGKVFLHRSSDSVVDMDKVFMGFNCYQQGWKHNFCHFEKPCLYQTSVIVLGFFSEVINWIALVDVYFGYFIGCAYVLSFNHFFLSAAAKAFVFCCSLLKPNDKLLCLLTSSIWFIDAI